MKTQVDFVSDVNLKRIGYLLALQDDYMNSHAFYTFAIGFQILTLDRKDLSAKKCYMV